MGEYGDGALICDSTETIKSSPKKSQKQEKGELSILNS